jgi:deoxyribose-phosphate aldolase
LNNQEILSRVDHTILKPIATWEDVKQICDDALKYKTASVCIPPSFVKDAKSAYGNKLNICAVIGFPLGYNTTAVKVFEAKEALEEGANEIDMVINVGALKDKKYDYLLNEIGEIKKAVGDKILKVIVETCYLSEEEKIKICEIVTSAGADFIKTSTGLGSAGATRDDVALFKKHIGKNVKIKAAGGIKTKEDLVDFISLGCERIGSSSAISVLKGETAGGY